MAHFGKESPSRTDRELAARVRRLDWTETAGELGAHVREARSKRSNAGEVEAFSWHWRTDTPHAPLELVSACDAEGADLSGLYGVFRSRAGALRALRELGKAYGLCNVVLGIEEPGEDGACAAYARSRCRGACIGREPRLAHAMRAVQALSRLRLKPWPYAGAVTVRETSPDGARSELHVIDRWRYLGAAHSDAEVHELAHAASLPPFDLDMYRVLARLLKAPTPRVEIVEADIMARPHYAYSRRRT
jgi:DNA polymerase-3 subunit epsilon